MHAICKTCSRASLLKNLALSSKVIGQCSVCGSKSCQIIETNSRDFVLAIKALIRYHYSEWEYHRKLGGDGLEALFFRVDNPIVNLNPSLDSSDYEDFLLSFLNDIDSDQQISLFTAYGREIYQYLPMRAISEGGSALISSAWEELKRRNHFLVEAEYLTRFDDLRNNITITLDKCSVWHRARIGAKKRAADADYTTTKDSYYYEPYAAEMLGAPPVGTTSAGRLNRPGVSYLYLASDRNTAVAEVRPHPGEFVSLGAFKLKKNLTIADLSQHQLTNLFRSNKELEKLEIIINMETAFATAAPPSNRQLYSLTQFLSEVLRGLGFEGVKFRSTVGNGDNLVIFDPDVAEWIPNSSSVVEINRVVYEHETRKLFDPEDTYDIDFESYAHS